MAAVLGTDWSCTSDVDPAGRMVSGRTCLAQAVYRRLITPRGVLIDDPNYGYDIAGELNDEVRPADVGRMQSAVQAECLKDERVVAASVTIVFAGGTLTVTIILTDSAGPFTLVLAVSAVTVKLLYPT